VKDLITKYQNEQNTRCEGYEAASGNIVEEVQTAENQIIMQKIE